MSKVRTFRDLIAWQKAMSLTRRVYSFSSKLPASEQFGLTKQMRRAVISVPSNIAEGHARRMTRDFIRFLRMAQGSLAELTTQIELATSMQMMAPDEELNELIAEVDRIVHGLVTSLENKADSDDAKRKANARRSR